MLGFGRPRVYFIYTHKNGKDRFGFGLKANTEISYWCFDALKSAFPKVVFLRLQDEKAHRIYSIGPQDVVIGHVGETFLRASERTKRVIAFYPWCGHEDRSTSPLFNCLKLEEELLYWQKAVSIILLTSEYNKKKYIDEKSNFWAPHLEKVMREKRVRTVHQPIDLGVFKRIKWEYNTSDFLYIGNDAHMKCLNDSKALVRALQRELHLFGVDGKKMDHLDEKQVFTLPALADFFIQPGMWEGQCVSILESAARGFIPVVSAETGYPYDHPFLLRFGDFDYNLRVLRELLKTPGDERKQLADALHQKLILDVHHNNWKMLTSALVEEVSLLLKQ